VYYYTLYHSITLVLHKNSCYLSILQCDLGVSFLHLCSVFCFKRNSTVRGRWIRLRQERASWRWPRGSSRAAKYSTQQRSSQTNNHLQQKEHQLKEDREYCLFLLSV